MAKEQLIERPFYLEKLKAWKDKEDLVKIVTGVRRCGKSKLFTLFQDYLLKTKKVQKSQIVAINLEDPLQVRKIGLTLNDKLLLSDYNTLLDFILSKLVKGKMCYVFIDEVQLVENWQQVANALRLQENVDVYLTGSNAYMFSSDLANSFGGRYVEIKMQPFSFKEYHMAYMLSHKDEALNENAVYNRYITESGFPQTLAFNGDRQLISDYLLNTVYLNTVQKDVVKRFNIAQSDKLDVFVNYLFDNIGNETSLRNIEKVLKSSGRQISVPTIDLYIKGLIDSYLVYKCDRYDIKGKQMLNGNAKYYVCDLGLRSVLLGHEDRDLGHVLENVVFLELLRRGYKVNVGTITVQSKGERKDIEVDFVAQKAGGILEYYQVALYTLDKDNFEREIRPLEQIQDNYPKYLLSLDFGEGNTNGIKRINVLDWLLKGDIT